MTAAGFVGRVGGLAAALGAGIVIGLSTSAPASADQSDSASRSDNSADTPSPRRSAAAAERSATAGTHPAKSAAAAAKAIGGSAPRSAAAVPARVETPARRIPAAAAMSLITSVPTPAAAIPTPVVVPDRQLSASPTNLREARRAGAALTAAPAPVAGATVATAPAPRPGPIARALSALFNCDPRGRLITIYKGTHFAIPNNFGGFFVQKVEGTGTFTADSIYDLKDVDQFDWNKFTGIAFAPLEPDLNSVMVGWRYNLTTEEFEIGPYYNVDKARISPQDPSQIISVPAGQTFNYLVDYSGVTLSYGDKTVSKPFPEGLTPNVWTAVRISGWFGGNEVAPRTVSYYIRFT